MQKQNIFEKTITVLSVFFALVAVSSLYATNWYIDNNADTGGDGSINNPFDTIQEGLDAAFAGDSVIVRAGTYTLTSQLNFPRDGTSTALITLKSYPNEIVLIERSTSSDVRLIHTTRDYIIVEGIIFDGNYGKKNGLVRFDYGSNFVIIRNCEIRRHGNHMLRFGCSDALVEDCHIHHACNTSSDVDAHCIMTNEGYRHTFRRCNVHHTTGDLWQGETTDTWRDIIFEYCNLHIELADEDCNGIPVGTQITENHFDTKDSGSPNRNLTIRYCTICGSRNSRTTSGGAMNLKKNVSGFVIHNNKIYDNRTAFRLRHPSTDYLIYNNLIYDNEAVFRLEDGITDLNIYNNTLYDNNRIEYSAGGVPGTIVWKNNIFARGNSSSWQGTYSYNLFYEVPAGWPKGDSNISGDPRFVDSNNLDLHMLPISPAINRGTVLSEVVFDYDGNNRPQLSTYDIGAYEFISVGNNVPYAEDDTVETEQGTTLDITFRVFDLDSDSLTYIIVNYPDQGTILDDDGDSLVIYKPDSAYFGSDSFTFKANDGTDDSNIATVSISIREAGANNPPTAQDDTLSTDENTALVITLQASDLDGDSLTYIIVSDPSHGTLSSDDGDSSVIYTPESGYMGSDLFTFRVNDGEDDSNTATVSINIGNIMELSVCSVTASEDDGNIPPNTIDNNLGTRWSAKGDGQWIWFDLCSNYTITYLSIAFHRGDERTADFDIEISPDTSSWTQVFSGSSSGKTLEKEIYKFANTDGRYMRIVGHGNSSPDAALWNSITEVDIFGFTTSAVKDRLIKDRLQYTLFENYPNPFNPKTTVSYSVRKAGLVVLDIYNITGQKVSTLVSGVKAAGLYSVIWDALDDQGDSVPSGIYFYRLQSGTMVKTKKMILTK